MISNWLNLIRLHPWFHGQLNTISSQTGSGYVIDAAGEKLAYCFYSNGESITGVNMGVETIGDLSGIQFNITIETDSSSSPSGTVVGAATANFAGPAGAGIQWINSALTIALGSATGTLSKNTPYWIVLNIASGTPDGTHMVEARTTNVGVGGERVKSYHSSAWQTGGTVMGVHLFAHTEGYSGQPQNASSNVRSTAADIYSTNKQGIRMMVGAKLALFGFYYYLNKAGTPGNFVVSVYEEDAPIYTETFATALIIGATTRVLQLATPVVLNPNKYIYIIISQSGTSDLNDWDFYCGVAPSGSLSAIFPDDHRFVYGTSSAPSGLTVSETDIPMLVPIISPDLVNTLSYPTRNSRWRHR